MNYQIELLVETSKGSRLGERQAAKGGNEEELEQHRRPFSGGRPLLAVDLQEHAEGEGGAEG